jgi:hypothetical protein
LINGQTGTLSSSHDTLGCRGPHSDLKTHERHQTDPYAIDSLSSDKILSADYGLFGINQTLEQTLSQAPMASRDVQLQHTPGTVSLSHNATVDIDFASFSNTMQAEQISSQNNGFRYANMLDPFSGYDIPFWFEQDQYWDIFQNFD